MEIKFRQAGFTTPSGLDFGELVSLGNDGWEAAAYVPVPIPDEPGVLATTIGWMVMKRPVM